MSVENTGEHLYPKRVSHFSSSKVTKIVSLHGVSMQKTQESFYSESVKWLNINMKIKFILEISILALVLHHKY